MNIKLNAYANNVQQPNTYFDFCVRVCVCVCVCVDVYICMFVIHSHNPAPMNLKFNTLTHKDTEKASHFKQKVI